MGFTISLPKEFEEQAILDNVDLDICIITYTFKGGILVEMTVDIYVHKGIEVSLQANILVVIDDISNSTSSI